MYTSEVYDVTAQSNMAIVCLCLQIYIHYAEETENMGQHRVSQSVV